MLALVTAFHIAPANDTTVSARGEITAMGRSYSYERLGAGRYRLSRGFGRGRVEVTLSGTDTHLTGRGDGLGWLTFAVKNGRLEIKR